MRRSHRSIARKLRREPVDLPDVEPGRAYPRCGDCGAQIQWTTDGDGGLVRRCNCRVWERLPGRRKLETGGEP